MSYLDDADGDLAVGGASGPAPGWLPEAGDKLDFGLTPMEVEGVLTSIADRLIQRLQARADRLARNPRVFLEDEVRRQMLGASASGDYAEVQELIGLLLEAESVAPNIGGAATPG